MNVRGTWGVGYITPGQSAERRLNTLIGPSLWTAINVRWQLWGVGYTASRKSAERQKNTPVVPGGEDYVASSKRTVGRRWVNGSGGYVAGARQCMMRGAGYAIHATLYEFVDACYEDKDRTGCVWINNKKVGQVRIIRLPLL